MAKILYGIAGEGMGHAVRSKIILDFLVKKHKVIIFGGGNAYEYLSKYYDINNLGCFRFKHRKNSVSIARTLLYNLLMLPGMALHSLKMMYIFLKFKPDVVMTDFEPFTNYMAFLFRIPCISLCFAFINTKFLSRHKIITNKRNYLDYLASQLVTALFSPPSSKYIISSFFNSDIKDKKTIVINPIIREQILKAKPKNLNYILVYSTTKSNKDFIKLLLKIKENFIVYGFDKNVTINNIKFKKISDVPFTKDFVVCKAVIGTGGFNLISECMFLKKPMLTIPVKNRYEQTINALHLERLGYGMYSKNINKKVIEKFIGKIPKYRNKLKNSKKYNNKEALRKISDAIKSLS